MSVRARPIGAIPLERSAHCNGCGNAVADVIIEFGGASNMVSIERVCFGCAALLTAGLLVLLPPTTTERNTP